VFCGPAACGCCGHGLGGEPVLGTPQKRQVFEAAPSPPPSVTEYQAAAGSADHGPRRPTGTAVRPQVAHALRLRAGPDGRADTGSAGG
ncbi:MAG TPA: hypothetical protein VI365_37110, partial [Trebonia sp.]